MVTDVVLGGTVALDSEGCPSKANKVSVVTSGCMM